MNSISRLQSTWFALAVVAGQERFIRTRIFDRLERVGVSTSGLTIVAPEEEVVVRKGSQSSRKRRLSMPGYLLMSLRRPDKELLAQVNRVKGVLSFVGPEGEATPLPEREVERLLGTSEPQPSEDGAAPVKRVGNAQMFSVGDSVRIVEGPMSDLTGAILEIDEAKDEARVELQIFGRPVPTAVPLRTLARA